MDANLHERGSKNNPIFISSDFTSILQFSDISVTSCGFFHRILNQALDVKIGASEEMTIELQLWKGQSFFMKMRVSLSAIVSLALCLLSSLPLPAQTKKKWTLAEIVAKAQPGQWVEIDGVIRNDQSVLALEIDFKTGDFMDDDWKLLAKVRTVTPDKNEFQVLSVPVKVTKDTEFDEEESIKSLDDIKPEMLVKLEGTYLKEGIFLAKEVDNEAKKLRTEPEFDRMLEVVGKIAQVDKAKRTITVMGIQFHLTEETEGKSLIK